MRLLAVLFLPLLLLAGCLGPAPYRYHYVPGRTAELRGDQAVAPPGAPEVVQAVLAAGNRIAGTPYAYGAGHGPGTATSFDCSGAVSYVLREAGLLHDSMPSRGFRKYGKAGPGEWITLYARRDHVFLVVAGLRFDTGWTGVKNSGPMWTTNGRPAGNSVLRHPAGY